NSFEAYGNMFLTSGAVVVVALLIKCTEAQASASLSDCHNHGDTRCVEHQSSATRNKGVGIDNAAISDIASSPTARRLPFPNPSPQHHSAMDPIVKKPSSPPRQLQPPFRQAPPPKDKRKNPHPRGGIAISTLESSSSSGLML
ncbi:MAG: hypothetical protein Q9205_007129, partial [Flavoplaca limonia]